MWAFFCFDFKPFASNNAAYSNNRPRAYSFARSVSHSSFRWGQGYALAERGYEAIGGEALLLGLPLFWYLTETTIRDTVRDFRKGGRRK